MPFIQTKIRYELGCQLGYQGPRQNANSVGKSRNSGDKSATGHHTKHSHSLKDSLNMLQWNAEGLGTSKTLELKKLLKDRKIHIALIQETKLKSKQPPSFPGYDIYKNVSAKTCARVF